ncbi:MAG: DUF1580 domain-containing protein [Planctomycetes bacterium]|nr:DUF1580 domain-containing protein [Planctomycetota bacterium]
MIDIRREPLLTLADATKLIPGRSGKKLSIQAIHRWALDGVGGTRLETVIVGARKMTSAGAIQRFIEARTSSASVREFRQNKSGSGPLMHPVSKCQKEVDEALQRAGIINPKG